MKHTTARLCRAICLTVAESTPTALNGIWRNRHYHALHNARGSVIVRIISIAVVIVRITSGIGKSWRVVTVSKTAAIPSPVVTYISGTTVIASANTHRYSAASKTTSAVSTSGIPAPSLSVMLSIGCERKHHCHRQNYESAHWFLLTLITMHA